MTIADRHRERISPVRIGRTHRRRIVPSQHRRGIGERAIGRHHHSAPRRHPRTAVRQQIRISITGRHRPGHHTGGPIGHTRTTGSTRRNVDRRNSHTHRHHHRTAKPITDRDRERIGLIPRRRRHRRRIMPSRHRRRIRETPIRTHHHRTLGSARRTAVAQQVTVGVGRGNRSGDEPARRVRRPHRERPGGSHVVRGHGDLHGGHGGVPATAQQPEGQEVEQAAQAVNVEAAAGVADRHLEGVGGACTHIGGAGCVGVGAVRADRDDAAQGVLRHREFQRGAVRVDGVQQSGDHTGDRLAHLLWSQGRCHVAEDGPARRPGGDRCDRGGRRRLAGGHRRGRTAHPPGAAELTAGGADHHPRQWFGARPRATCPVQQGCRHRTGRLRRIRGDDGSPRRRGDRHSRRSTSGHHDGGNGRRRGHRHRR